MNTDERRWIEEATLLCKTAAEKGVTLLMIRKQDANDEGDYVITNATDPKMVAAMNGNYEAEE